MCDLILRRIFSKVQLRCDSRVWPFPESADVQRSQACDAARHQRILCAPIVPDWTAVVVAGVENVNHTNMVCCAMAGSFSQRVVKRNNKLDGRDNATCGPDAQFDSMGKKLSLKMKERMKS